MRIVDWIGAGRAAAIAAGAVVAACGSVPGPAPEGTVTVVKVARTTWNAEAAEGLFRVGFDERRWRQVAARAGYAQAPEGLDPNVSEVDGLEEEASRELRDRGLCPTSAKLVSPVSRDAAGGVSAIFVCRKTVF
ncbi:MAG TPA: hypothetical protein VFX72_02260 [Usitatibacteraceae bacterium]|nr:hypothetical protein [Usitatibacteraceae bacterium]